jgi:hypothetical protein
LKIVAAHPCDRHFSLKIYFFVCGIEKRSIFAENFNKIKIMATITLEYNTRNIQAQKTLDYILSMGFFKSVHPLAKKNRLQQSLKDVDKGKVFFLAGPAKP